MEYVYLSTIAITFILNCYVLFFKEYFKEKGKNIATKEDIEIITAKIENVRLEINHSHSQKIEFLEKHKIALMAFYEEFIYWQETSIKDISIVDSSIFSNENIREKITELTLQKSKVEKSFWKLLIFESLDEDFIKKITTIYLKTNELYLLTLNFILSIEQNSLKISKSCLTRELAEERRKIRNTFIDKRDKLEKETVKFPSLLMTLLRKKYGELYK